MMARSYMSCEGVWTERAMLMFSALWGNRSSLGGGQGQADLFLTHDLLQCGESGALCRGFLGYDVVRADSNGVGRVDLVQARGAEGAVLDPGGRDAFK